jgi:uncharacterized repeat protein (TIGR03803 family)
MFDTTTGKEKVLYSFTGANGDGKNPYGSLILSGTTLYGMTVQGGAYGHGTIFQINTSGAGYKVLYSFWGSPDGASPWGSLILSGTTLYGMTYGGGAYGQGTIFMFDTATTVETVLYSFAGDPDGAYPWGSLILSGTTLYGMTHNGGTNNVGTIFLINTSGAGYQILHSFLGSLVTPNDGAAPNGSLTLSGTTLYGMTSGGGADGYGTIFQINTNGAGYEVLHNFGPTLDGAYPYGSLTLSRTTLYGMTYGGGAGSYGTIFQINTSGAGYQVLHSFAGEPSDGASPQGSLILSGTTLYGMTNEGGADGQGTIFSIPAVPLSTISGTVESSGSPMAGVTVTLSQSGWSASTTTNSSGFYSFPDLAPGSYTVKPTLTGYAFTPTSTPVTVGSNVTESFADFTGAIVMLSGKVTFKGAAVKDLTMELNSRGKTTTATTDASGFYIFSPMANGNYKVRPAVDGAAPSSATVEIHGKSVTQNFNYTTKP